MFCHCRFVKKIINVYFQVKVDTKRYIDHQQLLVAVHNQQSMEHSKEQERAVGALEKTGFAVQNEAKKNLLTDCCAISC